MSEKSDWKDGDFVNHWKHYIPPARASPSDLEFIRKKMIEKGKNVKVLILGSTVEYRDLCGQLGLPVSIFEMSKSNYEILGKEVSNKPKERLIEGNWLKKVTDEEFDIILADNVINMFKKNDIPMLLENIYCLLKNDGLLLSRTYIRRLGERLTSEEAVKEWKEKYYGEPAFRWATRDLYLSAYDFKKDYVILADIWKKIEQLHNKGIINDKDLEVFKKFSWKDRKFYFFMPLMEDLENDYAEFFVIEDIFYGTEPFLKNRIPLHVLKKK